ncbi:MAG: Fic family protein [Pseudoclavibacter sp.]
MDTNGGGTGVPPGIAEGERTEWPAIDFESARWSPDPGLPTSRRERLRQTGAYQAAVPSAIASLEIRIPVGVSAELDDASAALARFDATVDAILGDDATEMGPLHSVLLRTESASSSQIEGITVGARGLALAAIDAGGSHNGDLVVGNVRAMDSALAVVDDLSVVSMLGMHRALLERDLPEHAGRIRDQQVWIGGGSGPRDAAFVPPLHERVAPALDDLMVFARRADIPGLAHAALAHAQFETIHPFVDGNGRTGRALVQAMLRRDDITRRITAPISAGLLRDIEGYFHALTAFRHGDATPILRTFATAALQAADFGTRLAHALDDVRAVLLERAGARRGSAPRGLIDSLIAQPVITSAYVERRLGVPKATTHRAIERLVERGVLQEMSGRRRGRVWQAADVLDVLDAFAEELRRPVPGRR